MNVVLIGAGNLVYNLVPSLIENQVKILQIVGKSKNNLEELASRFNLSFTVNLKELNTQADIYLIAVNDDAIAQVVKQIDLSDQLVIHTSGSVSIDVFKNKFKNFGVFYPLQTFSKEKRVNFSNIPICIEANNLINFQKLKVLADKLSGKVVNINSEERKILHVSAVFASNFVNHMYVLAEELLAESNLDFEMLKPLIEETTKKILKISPQLAQTGPAKRKDKAIYEDHLKILEQKPKFKKIYDLITHSIIDNYFNELK